MTKVGKAALALAAVRGRRRRGRERRLGRAQQAKTVTIGWAYDGVGNMAAYDGPALATAKERIKPSTRAIATKLSAHHVQHAGQQAGDREGVRDEARLARAPTSS